MPALLLLCLSTLALVAGSCTTCDGSCEEIAEVKIGSLCANSICINGNPVPPGDADPCTVHDIVSDEVVSLRLKDCCVDNRDCLATKPSSCYVSECIYVQGEPRGWCKHTPIVDCCEDVGDCPKEKCVDYECRSNCASGLFFTELPGSQHRTAWQKRTVDPESQCLRCVGTPRPNCCLTSADCDSTGSVAACASNEKGICDANNQCQCVPTLQIECTHATQAVDCAYLEPKLNECPEECAAIVCSKGYCVIEASPGVDADGDGAPCEDDCDDSNPAAAEFVYCANPTGRNNDNDAFLSCGTSATRRCGACNEGEVEVVFDDLTCATPAGPCTLEHNCDCCDDAPSNDRPDHEICCEANSVVNTPIDFLDCGGDPRPICVTKPADDAQSLTEQCHAWGVATEDKDCDCNNPAACRDHWRAHEGQCGEKCISTTTKRKRQGADCDDCADPENPNALHPDKICLRDCDGDGNPVCAPDADSVVGCCLDLQNRASPFEFVNINVKTCCAAIIALDAAEDGLPLDFDATTDERLAEACGAGSVPYIPSQCTCDEGYLVQAELSETAHIDYCECAAEDTPADHDYIVLCGKDEDGDCTAGCEGVRQCTTEPVAGNNAAACEAIGLLPAPEDATCDCNDADNTVTYYHGCFPDGDGDTYPDCTTCTSVCGECPEGTFAIRAPIILSTPGAPRVRAPLGHAHGKRIVPTMCTLPAVEFVPCPCASAIAPGDQCFVDDRLPYVDREHCDCCDSDQYAYPHSHFCSASPRLCPSGESASYDYDCDGDDEHKVLCEDSGLLDSGDSVIHDVDHFRYIRPCQLEDTTTPQPDAPNVFENAVAAGECMFDTEISNCTTTHGFCLERKRAIGTLVKRAAGDGEALVPAPIECNGRPVADTDNPLPPNSCFEFLAECHARPIENPTMCHCDCDVCVIVAQ